jgi:hypothetical protein
VGAWGPAMRIAGSLSASGRLAGLGHRPHHPWDIPRCNIIAERPFPVYGSALCAGGRPIPWPCAAVPPPRALARMPQGVMRGCAQEAEPGRLCRQPTAWLEVSFPRAQDTRFWRTDSGCRTIQLGSRILPRKRRTLDCSRTPRGFRDHNPEADEIAQRATTVSPPAYSCVSALLERAAPTASTRAAATVVSQVMVRVATKRALAAPCASGMGVPAHRRRELSRHTRPTSPHGQLQSALINEYPDSIFLIRHDRSGTGPLRVCSGRRRP